MCGISLTVNWLTEFYFGLLKMSRGGEGACGQLLGHSVARPEIVAHLGAPF